MTDDNGNVHTCKGHIELFTMEDTKCEIENVKKMYSTIGHRYSGGGLAEVKEDLKVSNKELECVKHYGAVVEKASQEHIKDLKISCDDLRLTCDDLRLARDDSRETNKYLRTIIHEQNSNA